jgi:hypothetical protein
MLYNILKKKNNLIEEGLSMFYTVCALIFPVAVLWGLVSMNF